MKFFLPTSNGTGVSFNADITPDAVMPKKGRGNLVPTFFHIGNPYRRVYRDAEGRFVVSFLGKLHPVYLFSEPEE